MYFDGLYYPEHSYTIASIGLKKNCDKTFSSRQSANEYMYKLIEKYSLVLKEVFDDKHFKTYVCTNGVRFFINRV